MLPSKRFSSEKSLTWVPSHLRILHQVAKHSQLLYRMLYAAGWRSSLQQNSSATLKEACFQLSESQSYLMLAAARAVDTKESIEHRLILAVSFESPDIS